MRVVVQRANSHSITIAGGGYLFRRGVVTVPPLAVDWPELAPAGFMDHPSRRVMRVED